MKYIFTLLLSPFFIMSIFAQAGKIIWEDNFDEGQLDLSKWTIETGTGVNGDWGTGQLDRATDRVENVSFANNIPGAKDGCLVITTRKETYIDRNYTSGRINTAEKAAWGPGHRIVARIFPRDVNYKGQGFAFWMMPNETPDGWDYIMWPQGGEIDIMEYVGSIPFHNLGSVHYAWFWENNQWQEWNHGHSGFYYSFETQQVPIPSEPGYGGYPPSPTDSNSGSYGFHNYGIDWYKDRMEFFVDDNIYHIHFFNDGGAFHEDGQDEDAIRNIDNRRIGVSEYSNHFKEWYPFEHDMYIILSAGVGGQEYTYGGPIVPEAEFPCSVFIDWVRVYELDNPSGMPQHKKDIQSIIYPNPAHDRLHVEINNPQEYTLKIIDVGGKTIMHYQLSHASSINISNLECGVYLVLLTNNDISYSRKIIIE